ncbi:oligomeric, coiled-coil, peripheral membrane protein [Mortierella sp. NVP85]|nr:oligomeric, coiled-coil, peripheral membrane protein [Mortierella sp. NVP85]
MKLYRAETGKRVQIPQLRPNDGLDTLRLAIEKVTRIPQPSQILMTSDGLQLKPDMMFDAITSTGEDEYTIMVYNREVLTTDISSSILTLTEQAKTDPMVQPLSAAQLEAIIVPNRLDSSQSREWSSRFEATFDTYISQVLAYYKAIMNHASVCERIMEELRVQSLAVQVALTNLDAHSRSVLETFEKFNAFATKEFNKQARLLLSFPRDIEALRQIRIHPALLPADSGERYISDFIPTEKLVRWAEGCKEIHEGLLRDGKDLSHAVKEVQEGTIAIRSNSGINLDQLEDAMTEILQTVDQQSQIRERAVIDQGRVKERLTEMSRPAGFSVSISTLESLAQLANVYVTDYLDTSRRADDMLRDKLSVFVSAKRSQTANLITQLMHISKLQSTIASIPPSLSSLDDSLRKRDADFGQLVLVQRIPIAYGALVVEIVRRREYSKLLLQKSQQLAEVLSRFKQQEQRRRDSFRSDIAKFVPVVVPGMDDVAPFCEINALNTRDRLPAFTKEHITEFERLINQLSIGLGGPEGSESHVLGGGPEQSMIGANSISSGQETSYDALSKLRVTLAKMTAQMDIMGGEFDRILEKSFLTDRIQKLEEENQRLKADMSRADLQHRSGTPQSGQHPSFPSRHGTPVGTGGVGSIVQGSTATGSSSKLTRQPSRSGSNSTPNTHRTDVDEQQQILQQQVQRNQRLAKENTDLSTKIKAYETRIRSLEETLYQNFRAGSSVESSVSSKDSRPQSTFPPSDPSEKTSKDIPIVQRQSLAKEQEQKLDEERFLLLERDLQNAHRMLEDAEAKCRAYSNIEADLRQELLELRLQSAALEGASDETKPLDGVVIQQQHPKELDTDLKAMTLKYETLVQRHEEETALRASDIKDLKGRMEEQRHQLELEKEIMEGQLEQVRQSEKEALDRVTELENELAVVNDELQNKVLELEEELENRAVRHDETAARLQEQEQQLKAHQAVHDDILIKLKEQEKKAAEALQEGEKIKEDYARLQAMHATLETEREALTKAHHNIQETNDGLAKQTETLRKQVTDLETQRDAYMADVNLRLEEAKLMVQRAEEDWRDKARLLGQMERATKDLAKPIQDCMEALDKRPEVLEITNLVQVRESLLEIVQGIQTVVNQHKTDQTRLQKAHEDQLEELRKDRQANEDILHGTMSDLRKANEEAVQRTEALKAELETTTSSAKDLRSLRLLLGTLSLDLGIPLVKISGAIEDVQETNYPTSSILLETSETRSRSASALISPTPTFDLSDLNVAETTALIKKKVLDTEHVLKKWQRECKHLKEKYNNAAAEAYEKIAVRNFKVNDLTLFLPTRNSVMKPWAAFNINFPHYFLQMTPAMSTQLRNREWIVARINSITEAVVDKRLETEDENGTPSSPNTTSPHNPFGLADGVKYYLLEATSWNGYHGKGSSSSSSHHPGSGSSSKQRHHGSSSTMHESSSRSRREERTKDRREKDRDRDQEAEHRKHRERDGTVEEEDPNQRKMDSEDQGKDFSRTIASLQQAQAQMSKQKRLSQVQSDTHSDTGSGSDLNRSSLGSAPISIPYQSAATNALRAISSSVGSTGSGVSTMVASSPPRSMIMSSSPHLTGVSTVSAIGTTVSVNPGMSSPSVGSYGPSVPTFPSRLSQDTSPLAVFATDEEQEQNRTVSSNLTTSTWNYPDM